MINLKKLVEDIKIAGYETIEKIVKDRILKLDGELVEVGVSVGNTAEIICKTKGSRPLHLFDTFEGHPKGYIGKYDWGQSEGRHKADINEVKKRLKDYQNVYFYKGIFPDTSNPIKDKKFCFVYLDTDLYKSTYEALDFFKNRMVKGGVILFDDIHGIPGVMCAIEDYCIKHEEEMNKLLLTQPDGIVLMSFINKILMNFK